MDRDEARMPDVPPPDFVGMMCEIWFTVNYAAYHLAYTRVYLQTRAMQTHVDDLRLDEKAIKNQGQVDVIICRSHVASFFWQLHHVFEAMEIAIKRGQKEHPKLPYFYSQERALGKVRETAIPKEIEAYRNESHNVCASACQLHATTFRRSSVKNGRRREGSSCITSCHPFKGTSRRI